MTLYRVIGKSLDAVRAVVSLNSRLLVNGVWYRGYSLRLNEKNNPYAALGLGTFYSFKLSEAEFPSNALDRLLLQQRSGQFAILESNDNKTPQPFCVYECMKLTTNHYLFYGYIVRNQELPTRAV